jgi:hypothetical protein
MKVRDETRKDTPTAYNSDEVKSPWCSQPENPAFEKREDRGSLSLVVSAEGQASPEAIAICTAPPR